MKKIPLTKGKFALVDDEDYDYLIQWKWHFSKDKYGGYATRTSYSPKKTIKMHRVINQTPKGSETDHIDGDKLNNQKYNLRTVTNSQNQMNKNPRIGASSKYKGVSFDKETNKWRSYIGYKKKMQNIGRFSSEEEAALSYNSAALKFHGRFARLNEV